jgi:hypothetical protein
VVDTKKDLNAYAKVENQGGCYAPTPAAAATACCAPAPVRGVAAVHGGLSDLLSRYDVNEFAASVQVYAVKPGGAG